MRITLFFCFVFLSQSLLSQDFRKTNFEIKKDKTVKEFQKHSPYLEVVNNLEMPLPDGNSSRSYLIRQKKKSKEYYKKHKKGFKSPYLKSVMQPIRGDSFTPHRWVNGKKLPVYGGIPSDNTLAVSNDGVLLLSMNSNVWAYDLNNDTTLFENQAINLSKLVGGSTFNHYYDPKVAYDPEEDRFVLALLKGNTPATSEVIMCFSSTNDPRDPWYIYNLPGTPLNNDRWTDFPTISIT